MKKLKLQTLDLGVSEILTREQLKNVMGADGSGGGRCFMDRLCSMYSSADGACAEMQTGQCRCVKYSNGLPSESVPDSFCQS